MEQINLNLIPNGIPAVCHVSQYDNTGRKIRFRLFNGSDPYVLSDTETIKLHIRKSNGEILIFDIANTSSDYIDLEIASEMSDVSGESICKFYIENSNISIGSFNFKMRVEPDAFDGKITTSEAKGPIASFETDIEDNLIKLKSEINPVQDLHGYSKPWSGGGGKNLLNNPNKTTTQAAYVINNVNVSMIAGYYMLSFDFSGTSNSSSLRIDDENGTAIFTAARTITSGHNEFLINLPSNASFVKLFSNAVGTYTKFQIERGNQFTSYEPYSNICPISGFSALNVTRTGKNLAHNTATSQTVNGVTYTVATDGRVKANGTASGTSILDLGTITLMGGMTYTLSGCPSGGSGSTYALFLRGSGSFAQKIDFGGGNQFTVTDTVTTTLSMIVYNGYTASDLTFEPMVRLSDATADFEPYNGQTATVNFGQTVFKGSLNLTTGLLTVTHALTPLNNKSWVKSGNKFYTTGFDNAPDGALYTGDFACAIGIPVNKEWNALSVGECCLRSGLYSLNKWSLAYCSDAYATVEEFVSALNENCTITYPLATPIEITTTPENISTVDGINNIFNDTNGDVEVKFYKTKNLGGD